MQGFISRIIGFFLLILPFLPFTVWGQQLSAVDLKYSFGPRDWLFGILIAATLAWLGGMIFSGKSVPAFFIRFWNAYANRISFWAVPGIALITAAVTFLAFQAKPHLIDAVVQMFQAKIFAGGMITAPAPLYGGFFVTQHMLMEGSKWYGQYAPGHSLVLALGYLIGMPWLPGVVLTAASAGLAYRFTRNVYGPSTARITLFLFLLCPFFLMMGASYMNHVTALFCMTLLLYSFERWVTTNGWRWAALAGGACGFGAASRTLDFLAIGLVLAAFVILQKRLLPRLTGIIVGLAAAVFAFSPYFFFNAATTGDPLLPGFIKLWGESHGLGFHESPWGEQHTLGRGIINQLINISLLNEYLFETLVPSLLPLGFALFLGRLTQRWDWWLLIGFLSQPLAYLFYWHRDSFLGPRYLYATLPFILPLLARAGASLWEWSAQRTMGVAGIIKPVSARAFLISLLVVSLTYSLAIGIPMRARIYATGLSSMKQDLLRQAHEAGITEGTVFVAVSWGGRLISNLRELGVPASLIEIAYRNVDHCDLTEIVEHAFQQNLSPETATAAVEALLQRSGPVRKVMITSDRTLRFAESRVPPLPPLCAEELRYDQAGFTVFEPQLLHNEPELDRSGILFARDLRHRNHLLAAAFPERKTYLYRPGGFVETSLP